MGHPDGAHTHGGGSGLGPVLLVILAVVLLGPPAVAAAGELLNLIVIVAAAIVGLAAAGELLNLIVIVAAAIVGLAAAAVVALVASRVHRRRAGAAARVSLPALPTPPALQARAEPRPAIERPAEVHLHFHGVPAEDVAAIIERHSQDE
jgi:hypothetical protein